MLTTRVPIDYAPKPEPAVGQYPIYVGDLLVLKLADLSNLGFRRERLLRPPTGGRRKRRE